MKILLDAGHGAGKAHNRGGLYYNEGDNNFYYSLVLKSELEKYQNVKVNLVRKKITDNPSLAQRSAMGSGYDLFLSLHSNAFSDPAANGTTIIDSLERPNTALAKDLSKAIADTFGHRNRGAVYKEGQPGYNWYGVLRFNKAGSSMIVEHGFHTNPKDCLFFKNNHIAVAVASAKVIAKHYGLKLKGTTSKPESNQGGEVMYRVQVGAFKVKGNADKLLKELKSKGYDAYIRTEVDSIPAKQGIKVGSRVKIKQGAKSYNGTGLSSFVYRNTYTVDQLKNNRAVLDTKGINTPVHIDDLILV
ncbi:N-acetylmuramoyl-L-alanine amidase [Wansuia hejianensis]|uniref:N-acetylmuramoyl-L-alanine amidase n=1 Tax=Wansuia hejianensis TaxID=2763667 RepID=A0A926EZX9_9FIRM|nr:N-acetylmuramoyl-L-alanine amidase [Wansuia hejianensis]MBC8590597.1 N-acetylmuramoyl-L-alanine amidase [Wansuia hejianensis]